MSTAERGDRCRIPPLAPEGAARVLAPPLLPAAAARTVPMAREAGGLGLAVHLSAPAAAPRLLIARALHAVARRPGPLFALAGPAPPLGGFPAGSTVYVDVGGLRAASALALEAVLDDGTPWVIAAVAPGTALADGLAVRLAAVVLDVPALAARPDDVPVLAADAVARLAARRGVSRPALAPEALAWLARQPWPGDVAQLEAVVGRALLAAGGAPVLRPEHLVLAEAGPDRSLRAGAPACAGPGPATPPAAPAPEPAAVQPAASGPEADALELLLAELAHEIKNPLVTVKTFAEHLPDLLGDAELRERFATLAGEAIGRMDDVLENLLAFARLGPPVARATSVGALLDRALIEADPALSAREVTVRRTPGDARCAADPEHVAYALRNLLAGIAREVPARGEVTVDSTVNGVVRVGFATANGAAARLRRLATPDGRPDVTDPTMLPLAFTLARSVLERGGGSLAVVPDDAGRTAVVVRLPAAVDAASGA